MSPSRSPAGNRVGLCLSITAVIKYLQRLTGHFRQARSEPHRLFLGPEETELGKGEGAVDTEVQAATGRERGRLQQDAGSGPQPTSHLGLTP